MVIVYFLKNREGYVIDGKFQCQKMKAISILGKRFGSLNIATMWIRVKCVRSVQYFRRQFNCRLLKGSTVF